MKKIFVIVMTSFLVMSVLALLTGCGFSPRSPKHVPPQLRTVYLDASNPYDPLVVSLERTLRSVNVHFVKDRRSAPVTLHISKINWYYYIPTIVNSGNAINYNYTLSVTYQLQTAAGTIIVGPQTVSVTRSLLQNANQIYAPEAVPLMRREISRAVVILMYHSLTSESTRKALAAAFKNK